MWILRIIYKQNIKENNAGTEKRVFLHNSNIQLWRTAWLRIKIKDLNRSLWSKSRNYYSFKSKLITSNISQYHLLLKEEKHCKKLGAVKTSTLLLETMERWNLKMIKYFHYRTEQPCVRKRQNLILHNNISNLISQ